MSKIRVTKQFDFEAAHALENYSGKCRDIHGHSYHFRVTVIGEVRNDKSIEENGMVIDFAILKKVVKNNVVDVFDHTLVLRSDSRFRGIEAHNDRVMYVDYQPTCENMLLDMVNRIRNNLPHGISLHNAFLRETARSYAEWFATDNL